VKRAALLSTALVLVLAGCGGERDDVASPEPSASSSPAGQECPITAKTVPAPADATKDLATKPAVPANAAPPPTEVTVADVVVGSGDEATTLSSATVKYVGAFYSSGEEFDSSWSRGPDETFDLTVCASGTIPGFAIAPTGMKVGGRRLVTIPAELAYGAEGSPPTIPPDSPLVFVIDLVGVTPPQG
jgi:FKBP-type peptidyl-prolyl cis-trans isomerase